MPMEYEMFSEDAFAESVRAKGAELMKNRGESMAREILNKKIRGVIGENGLNQLTITLDTSSDPPGFLIDGPPDLVAKANEATSSED
jgi:hypothetical protein